MTGYGCASRPISLKPSSTEQTYITATITVEIRSVNSRFLDFCFRAPDEYRSLEASARKLLSQRFTRGKIECRLHIQYPEFAKTTATLNTQTLQHLHQLANQVKNHFPQATPLSTYNILCWPGLLQEPQLPEETLQQSILDCVHDASQQLYKAREQEGKALILLLLEKARAIQAIIISIKPLLPQQLQAYQRKIAEKFAQALQSANIPTFNQETLLERMHTELTAYGLRIDVDEELSRLETHLQTIEDILQNNISPSGKKLDFMMQELNREANTLASKSTLIELSNAAIEIKLLIEQMREQIQNLE